MTLKQGLDTANKVINQIEGSGLFDANGNLVTPTLAGVLALLVQLNATIVAAGVTEGTDVQKVVSIITAVSSIV